MHNTCCISQSTTASLAAASNSSLLPSFSSTPGSICRPSSSFSISVSSELTVLAFSFSTIFSIFHTLSVTMHKTRFCFNLVFIFEYIFHQVWNSLCDEHWYCQCVCDSIITVINVFYICGKIINSLTSAPIHFEKQTTSLQKSFHFSLFHSLIACSRHRYIWCCSLRTSRLWWIAHSTQRQPTERLQCK